MEKVEFVEHVLVERLVSVYWQHCFTDWTLEKVLDSVPIPDFIPDFERVVEIYDLGRVHYFLKCIQEGKELDPIDLETRVYPNRGGPPSWGGVSIFDGRHRFAAAVLAKAPTILVSFGGLIEQLAWLTGKIDEMPDTLEVMAREC